MPVITVICGDGVTLFKASGLISRNDWTNRALLLFQPLTLVVGRAR